MENKKKWYQGYSDCTSSEVRLTLTASDMSFLVNLIIFVYVYLENMLVAYSEKFVI